MKNKTQLKEELKQVNAEMDKVVLAGGQVRLNDPLVLKARKLLEQIKRSN